MKGIRESIDFTTNADLWSWTSFTPGDGSGIGCQFSNWPKKPNEDSDDKSENTQADKGDRPDNGLAAILDKR